MVVPLAVTEFDELSPVISPNGRWLAYVSNDTGRDEIYVSPFPEGRSGGQVQVSTDGGREPVWAHSGRELFYRNGGAHPQYDVSPDDRRFVMLRIGGGEGAVGELILVQNFFEEVKERVGN